MEQTLEKAIKTKASIKGSMKRSAIILLAVPTFLFLVLLTGQTAVVFAQDLVVLSHRFDESSFSSEIIGEVMNNDTRSYDMFDINIYANLRGPTGSLLVSEQGFIDSQTLRPGSSSAFSIFFLDEEIPDNTSTYDLIINDERLVVGQPLEESFSSSNGDNDNDNGGGGDSDSRGPLEDLLNGDDNNNDTDNGWGNDNRSGEVLEDLEDLINYNCIPEDTDCDGDMDLPFCCFSDGRGYYDEEPIEGGENDNDNVDDGYTYPDDATEEEKDEIDEQEQEEWEDAGKPGEGDESDGDESDSNDNDDDNGEESGGVE